MVVSEMLAEALPDRAPAALGGSSSSQRAARHDVEAEQPTPSDGRQPVLLRLGLARQRGRRRPAIEVGVVALDHPSHEVDPGDAQGTSGGSPINPPLGHIELPGRSDPFERTAHPSPGLLLSQRPCDPGPRFRNLDVIDSTADRPGQNRMTAGRGGRGEPAPEVRPGQGRGRQAVPRAPSDRPALRERDLARGLPDSGPKPPRGPSARSARRRPTGVEAPSCR